MFLMYVDESGDPGLRHSPSQYFILTGLVVHEDHWRKCQDAILLFRKKMLGTFGMRLREEIHASAMISKPGALKRIKRNDRLTILRLFTREIASLEGISIINIVVNKEGKPDSYDVVERAWTALLQRFSNTMLHGNFNGSSSLSESGIVIPDQSDTAKITALARRMRRYNPVPNQQSDGYRRLETINIIEDPHFKDSRKSLFIQAADVAAYSLCQMLTPCSYIRKKSAHNYFKNLLPVLCTSASSSDPLGLVRL